MANSGSGQNVGSVLAGALGAGVSAIPGAMAQERQQTLENIMTTMQFQNQLASQQARQEQLEISKQNLELNRAKSSEAIRRAGMTVEGRAAEDAAAAKVKSDADTAARLDLDQQLFAQQQAQLSGTLGNLVGTTRNLGPITGPDAFMDVPLTLPEQIDLAKQQYRTLDIDLGGGATLPGLNPSDLVGSTQTPGATRAEVNFNIKQGVSDQLASANSVYANVPQAIKDKIGLQAITSISDLQKVLKSKDFAETSSTFGITTSENIRGQQAGGILGFDADFLNPDRGGTSVFDQLNQSLNNIVNIRAGQTSSVAQPRVTTNPPQGVDPLDAEAAALERELDSLNALQ